MPRLSPTMVVSEGRGRPYNEHHFRHRFAEIRDAAGLDPDLRLWICGARPPRGQPACSTDMIRAGTGRASLQVVARYVRPDDTMARATMERLTQNRISTATENSSRGPTTEKL